MCQSINNSQYLITDGSTNSLSGIASATVSPAFDACLHIELESRGHQLLMDNVDQLRDFINTCHKVVEGHLRYLHDFMLWLHNQPTQGPKIMSIKIAFAYLYDFGRYLEINTRAAYKHYIDQIRDRAPVDANMKSFYLNKHGY